LDLKEDSKKELKKPTRCENNKYRLNVKATKKFFDLNLPSFLPIISAIISKKSISKYLSISMKKSSDSNYYI
jgi:hypothetical protein